MVQNLLRQVRNYFYFPTKSKILSYIAANTVCITRLCEVTELHNIKLTYLDKEAEAADLLYKEFDKLRVEVDTLKKEVRKLKRGKK